MRLTIWLCTLIICWFLGNPELTQAEAPAVINTLMVITGIWSLLGDITDLWR